MKLTLAERFEAKVMKTDACWSWTGSINGSGYGMIAVGGKSRRSLLAHRVSWTLYFGPIPDDKCVLHSCDNPPCVNPAHLFLGTRLDNAKDRHAKGRDQRGEGHAKSRLKESDIQSIVGMYCSGSTKVAIAKHFGVSGHAIADVLARKSWKHVPLEAPSA